jgi:hypothetical protein
MMLQSHRSSLACIHLSDFTDRRVDRVQPFVRALPSRLMLTTGHDRLDGNRELMDRGRQGWDLVLLLADFDMSLIGTSLTLFQDHLILPDLGDHHRVLKLLIAHFLNQLFIVARLDVAEGRLLYQRVPGGRGVCFELLHVGIQLLTVLSDESRPTGQLINVDTKQEAAAKLDSHRLCAFRAEEDPSEEV